MSLNLDPMVESARMAEGYVESDLHLWMKIAPFQTSFAEG